ncbi:MAG: hypothetical protein AAGF84_13715 [Planctomycetota bacterium]
MPTANLDPLVRHNRRLKLALIGVCGLFVLTFASGQVSVPENNLPTQYHVAVPVDNENGFVVLVRNDGRIYRVEKYGKMSRVIE